MSESDPIMDDLPIENKHNNDKVPSSTFKEEEEKLGSSSVPASFGLPSCVDKVVFDACVSVQRGSNPPHVVGFQFLFRHFDGMDGIKNTDGK